FVAYVVSIGQTTISRASSDVLLNRQDLGAVITGIQTTDTGAEPERYARTQAALARVPVVAALALERAEVTSMEAWQLLESSSVSPQESTDLLTFAVDNMDPDVAARLATAYASAFTAYKLKMDTTSLSRARIELQDRLDELRRTGASDTDAYRQLLQKASDLRTLEILQAPASVVRAATDASQVKPTPVRNAILGMALGLMIGLGAALFLNAIDRRIRDAEEIERELQLPLLARLPSSNRDGDRLTILDRPPDEVSDAVGRLRTSFDFANAEVQAKVIMAASASAGEGKSTTLADLAIALARTGRQVVLIDLDLRRPSLTRLFHLPDGVGVTDVATGNADLASALNTISTAPLRLRTQAREAETSGRPLHVMTAGRARVDPSGFVESAGLTELLDKLRQRAEIVLVDAPPILAAGDAMALTGKVDAIILVNRLGTLKRPTLAELARALRRSPAPILGFVATGAELGESYVPYGVDTPRRLTSTSPTTPDSDWIPKETRTAGGTSASAGRWAPRRPGG
ncbi:MAG TPA: P-loop NTPase, partial [Gaiellaceae bacterium]|nr:P-loop NTPase [Gaiellaceae bacterium]